jgi:hypothetical protein
MRSKSVLTPWILCLVLALTASVLVWGDKKDEHVFWFYDFVVLVCALPFLGLWLLYGVYVICSQPERRARQLKRIGYAFAALGGCALVIACCVAYRDSASCAYAERVVRAINSYNALHGRYPDTLEQVGFKTRTVNGQNRGSDWGVYYFAQEKGRQLIYPGLLPFSMNVYDFDKGRWIYYED